MYVIAGDSHHTLLMLVFSKCQEAERMCIYIFICG